MTLVCPTFWSTPLFVGARSTYVAGNLWANANRNTDILFGILSLKCSLELSQTS